MTMPEQRIQIAQTPEEAALEAALFAAEQRGLELLEQRLRERRKRKRAVHGVN